MELFFWSLKYTLIQLHSVSGILGYKINFDTNGDAEFNLTLLDMQPIGKRMLIMAFSGACGRIFLGWGIYPKTALNSGNVNGIQDLTDLTFTEEAASIANKVCDWLGNNRDGDITMPLSPKTIGSAGQGPMK